MADSPTILTVRDSIQQSRGDMLWLAADMKETVRLTRLTIHASRRAMAEADQLLARQAVRVGNAPVRPPKLFIVPY
jgi:hypothetical protein